MFINKKHVSRIVFTTAGLVLGYRLGERVVSMWGSSLGSVSEFMPVMGAVGGGMVGYHVAESLI